MMCQALGIMLPPAVGEFRRCDLLDLGRTNPGAGFCVRYAVYDKVGRPTRNADVIFFVPRFPHLLDRPIAEVVKRDFPSMIMSTILALQHRGGHQVQARTADILVFPDFGKEIHFAEFHICNPQQPVLTFLFMAAVHDLFAKIRLTLHPGETDVAPAIDFAKTIGEHFWAPKPAIKPNTG